MNGDVKRVALFAIVVTSAAVIVAYVLFRHYSDPNPTEPETLIAKTHGCPAHSLPFNLLFEAQDANKLPLNPEWAWQCSYRGNTETRALPDPFELCDRFDYNADHRSLNVGKDCSSEIRGWDAPVGGFSYVICHVGAHRLFPPELSFEDDEYVHGHVNWGPVTYTGMATFKDVADVLPGEDDDTTMYFYPAALSAPSGGTLPQPGFSSAPQWWAKTDAGMTPANEEGHQTFIELEYYSPEVLDAFASEADRTAWQSELQATKLEPAIVTGLFSLDDRHDAKTELHPVYGFAIRTPGGSPDSERWLVLFRNEGSQGECSSHEAQRHPLPTPNNELTISIPSPLIYTTGVALASSRLSGLHVPSSPAAPIRVQLSPGQKNAQLTARLLPPAQDPVLVGEVTLRWSGGRALPDRVEPLLRLAPRRPSRGPGAPPEVAPETIVPALLPLLGPRERAALLGTRTRRATRPLRTHRFPSSTETCAILAPALERARREHRHRQQVELAERVLGCRKH